MYRLTPQISSSLWEPHRQLTWGFPRFAHPPWNFGHVCFFMPAQTFKHPWITAVGCYWTDNALSLCWKFNYVLIIKCFTVFTFLNWYVVPVIKSNPLKVVYNCGYRLLALHLTTQHLAHWLIYGCISLLCCITLQYGVSSMHFMNQWFLLPLLL